MTREHIRSLARILVTALVIVLLVLAAGLLLPKSWRVEREILIQAPPAQVFPYLNSLKKWRDWAVWYRKNPQMTTEYSGPDAGAGATSRWSDADGRGAMKILQSVTDRRIVYLVLFDGGEFELEGAITLTPEGGGTRVVWNAAGEAGNNPVNRYFALLLSRWIGEDFAQSLAQLKALLEPKR
jgi:uncharacterized protein YndB with AHSA1/START domain